ncbi:probable protein arginine N-methyltransferase 1.2 isoform X2 [Drosophila santomea]|uniref:probable protein arginine N-methyltransferase 1.2 isoform X2 n=1 Tax=Drosophila santomea TaxID=129105 RepID=UPI00195338CF|nr:probable protein arginine N-methyltransferase 1.2 isoform X2 [Drosophila santomea]
MDLEKNLLRVMADSMLNDVISTRAYEWVFKRYERLFKDKIVMDVGCRSGLLSLMSVEAGAVKVMALGNVESAEFVKNAFSNNEKEDIFEFVEGDIHEIVLPCGLKKVDIIVSDHSIFVESLFKEVIYAREKWLVKGGLIIPNVAHLFVCGIAEHPRETIEVNILPQTDYPGRSYMVREPVSLIEDYVAKEQMVTEKFLLKTIDLRTAQIDDESFRVPFKLRGLTDSPLGAVVLYSDIGICRPRGKFRLLFSTGPKRPRTYLRQTILFMDDPVVVAKRELVIGDLGMYYKPDEHREVEYSFSFASSKVANSGSEEYVEHEDVSGTDSDQASDVDLSEIKGAYSC